jgi:hypothetical protein
LLADVLPPSSENTSDHEDENGNDEYHSANSKIKLGRERS